MSMTNRVHQNFSSFVEDFDQLYAANDFTKAQEHELCVLFFATHKLIFQYFGVKIPTFQLYQHHSSGYYNSCVQRTLFPALTVYSIIKRRLYGSEVSYFSRLKIVIHSEHASDEIDANEVVFSTKQWH